MKFLAESEVRCRDHSVHEPACEICKWLEDVNGRLLGYKAGRNQLIKNIEARAAKGEVTFIGIR